MFALTQSTQERKTRSLTSRSFYLLTKRQCSTLQEETIAWKKYIIIIFLNNILINVRLSLDTSLLDLQYTIVMVVLPTNTPSKVLNKIYLLVRLM